MDLIIFNFNKSKQDIQLVNQFIIYQDISMSEQGNTLKWGDIIRIHGVNLDKSLQQQSKGLIISKGFTDSNIYYQKYTNFENVNFYRQSLYQIMPISGFQIHDQITNSNASKSADMESLKKKAENQLQMLFKNLDAKKGEKILYGAEAIFRHVQSNGYLRGQQKAADTGQGAFMIEVSPLPCSQVTWKINSHRSYQHDGDDIFFDDQLLIYHMSTDCFMNFVLGDNVSYLDSVIKDEREIQAGDVAYDYSKVRPAIKCANQRRTSIINQNKNKCLWKFIQHCTADLFDQKKKIKSHDIVYFQHTKNKGCISSSLKGDSYYLKETVDKKPSFQSYWELIPKDINQTGPQNCNDFFARNIVTGQYLKFNQFKVRIISKAEVVGGGFQSHGLVNLICSEGVDGAQGRKLERGPVIPKDPSIPQTLKFAQSLYDLYELKDVEQLTEDSFFIMKVDDQTISNIMFILSSHEHLVKFLRGIGSYLIKERQRIAEVCASIPDNKQTEIQQRQNYQFVDTPIEQLQNLRSVLEMLSGKIYLTSFAEIVSSGNTPNPTIQKILVDTGSTQLLIEIIFQLYQGFKLIQNNSESVMNRVRKERYSDVFERVYILLEKIVVGNQQNKFYMSRWVDLFLQHSKNINRQYIQQCLVGILQNNPQAIEATINEEKILSLIKRFYEEANNKNNPQLTTKYLRLFSTFIKCEDRILKENQNIILDCFFKDQGNLFCYRFKVVDKEDEVQDPNDQFSKIKIKRVEIALHTQDFCGIPKYYKDWVPKWNYFLHFVNLLADVCMDKNNNAIENVSALISLQTVTIILNDPEIAHLNETLLQEAKKTGGSAIASIHEPFVRIAHYIYIWNSKFTPIKTVKNISRWYRHEGEEKGIVRKEDINRTKRPFEGQKQEQEYYYIRSILSYIESFIQKATQDSSNLNLLYTVLLLFKETVTLGLWTSITQFRKLIPLIIMRIVKMDDRRLFNIWTEKKTVSEVVAINKQEHSFNRPQNLQNINCKIKSAQIFRFMNELEIDIRLRYMMNFFKGLYEATQNFDDYNRPQIEPEIQEPDIDGRNTVAKEQFNKNEFTSILGDVRKISQDQDIMQKVNIWCNKFKQLTPFEHSLDFQNMSKNRYLFQGSGDQNVPNFNNMILALLELPAYKSDLLLNSSLRMLRMMFEQRKDLIEQFKGLLICGKGNLEEVYQTLKYMREKFQMLTNRNVLKITQPRDTEFNYFIDQPYSPTQKLPAKRSGILQDLFFLSRTLKQGINLRNIEALMKVEDWMFDQKTVFNYLTEKEKNNRLFQDMNIAEGIYLPLTNYIKLIGDSPLNQIHRRILFAIYQYLALLCFNNLDGKQKLMEYVLDIIPHLSKKVGAANFLYQVTLNNKNLIANTGLVAKIIDGALEACLELDKEDPHYQQNIDNKQFVAFINYQKSQVLFALRGILLLNNQGFRLNQELLMNRFQDNKFKRLIYKSKPQFISKRDNFALNAQQSYVASFFELFSVIVESKNFINVGKLENIHPYTYCLDFLKNTNRWQIRRSIRAYLNRLFYVNKDRDIFLFEEFIRKQFKEMNTELEDLISLYRNKSINDEVPIPNGIRFQFAISEMIEMILQIFITIEEMLLKPEFLKILKREIEKQQKKPQNQRQIHDQFVKLLYNIGCLNKLYPRKNIISSFIKQIKKHIMKVMMWFDLKFLEKQTQIDTEAPIAEEQDDLGVDQEKKNYIYDHSKSFFKNLSSMIRQIKAKQQKDRMRDLARMRTKKDGTPEELKDIFLTIIFSVQGENLKQIISKKARQVSTSLYKPHIQTANSRIFQLIAKPTLNSNEENIQFNRRLTIVKELIDQSPVFRKLKEDQFYKLVVSITNVNKTSQEYYRQHWEQAKGTDVIPVVPLREIFTKSFALIMNNHDTISDAEKIFVIKIARCYLTQAVEGKQNFKYPVDKWNAAYFPGGVSDSQPNAPDRKELIVATERQLRQRQELIMQCGGSQFIESIFKYYNTFNNKLQVLNQTLLLGIAYLFGGNSKCQNSFHSVLSADVDNGMMLAVKRIITNIGLILIQMRKIKEEAVGKQRQFAYSIVDIYDYLDTDNNVISSAFGVSGFDKNQIRNQKNNQLALCRVFRFLQLFCENGNNNMKQFLLAQTNIGGEKKTNVVNFIETTSFLLRKLFKVMNDKLVGIPATLLDFINQITQLPCINNQISFMKSTFFEDLSYLADYFILEKNLQDRKFSVIAETDADDQPITVLKAIYQKGIDLALCNLQGNDNILVDQFISKCKPKFLWMVIKQNLTVILRERAEIYQVIKQQQWTQSFYETNLLSKFNKGAIQDYLAQINQESPQFRDEILNILSVFYIIKKIQLYQSKKYAIAFADKNKPNLIEKENGLKATNFLTDIVNYAKQNGYDHISKFMTLFDTLILSIEVNSNNGREVGLQTIYYPKHPIFNQLSGDTRNDIMFRVKRQTQRDKLITLLSLKEQVYKQVDLNFRLQYVPHELPFKQQGVKFQITADYATKVRGLARNISFFICFLMLSFVLIDHDKQDITSTFSYTSNFTQFIMRSLAAAQLFVTMWFVVIWISLRKPLCLNKYDIAVKKEKQRLAKEKSAAEGEEGKKKDQSEIQGWDLVMAQYTSIADSVRPLMSRAKDAIMDNYFMRNVVLAFYSLATYESGFLSIMMFVTATFLGNFVGVEWYTIHLFDIFTQISELTNIFKAILNNIKKLTFLSFLAAVFILVFNVVSLNTYTPVLWQEDLPQQACEDVIDCVLKLYTGGAIGDDMSTFEMMRFFFDTVYSTFMDTMFAQIVGGIMIDAFSELKEQDQARDGDKKEFCYICGMPKPEMEKMGSNFEAHTEQRHFLWNYIYYLYVLEQKDPTDFTGLEFDIANQVGNDQTDWFPSLGEGDAEAELKNAFAILQWEMGSVFKNLDDSVKVVNPTIDESIKLLTSMG